MKYQPGSKFKVGEFHCEITGFYPGSQGRSITWHKNSYQMTLNGVPMDILEDDLELFKKALDDASQKSEPQIEPQVKDAFEPIAKVEEIATIKRGRGRPPKLKEGEQNG